MAGGLSGVHRPKPSFRQAVWLFVKAQLSAQMASLIDLLVTVSLALMGMYYLYATFLGAVVGGMSNCIINYRWVFHAAGCKKRHVALKYLLVWAGSIGLNTWGTYALTEGLARSAWVARLTGGPDNLFVFSKMVVAVLVGVLWNYQLQRLFVYRNLSLRRRKG